MLQVQPHASNRCCYRQQSSKEPVSCKAWQRSPRASRVWYQGGQHWLVWYQGLVPRWTTLKSNHWSGTKVDNIGWSGTKVDNIEEQPFRITGVSTGIAPLPLNPPGIASPSWCEMSKTLETLVRARNRQKDAAGANACTHFAQHIHAFYSLLTSVP